MCLFSHQYRNSLLLAHARTQTLTNRLTHELILAYGVTTISFLEKWRHVSVWSNGEVCVFVERWRCVSFGRAERAILYASEPA